MKRTLREYKEDVYSMLLDKFWKENEGKYGYIYNNDPKETIDTYNEVMKMYHNLGYRKKTYEVNLNVIPDRYQTYVEEYKKLFLDL